MSGIHKILQCDFSALDEPNGESVIYHFVEYLVLFKKRGDFHDFCEILHFLKLMAWHNATKLALKSTSNLVS